MREGYTNVVIADDDKDDQMLFKQAIYDISKDCKVTSVYNGFELLNLLSDIEIGQTDKGFKPDFILLDINMPLMNGFGALAQIKKTEILKCIPVYMLSTSHSQVDIRLANELGATGFYTKPTAYDDLKRMLNQIFNG